MPLLLNCQSVGKTYGARRLFTGVTLTISDGERIGLIGPNGAGKSTLMKILAGLDTPDSGEVARRKGVRLAYAGQDAEFEPGATVRSEIVAALPPGLDDAEREARLNLTMGRAKFTDPDQPAQSLSGGWQKRLAIARELARDPDILLLDEPTNHLDLAGIEWLEQLLIENASACVMVSHDRQFLENTATDMAEINRIYPDGIFRTRGSYTTFLEKREVFLAAQKKRHEALENAVRKEIEWLRRGPKARTTKSKARIDAAGRMIDELADYDARAVESTARLDFTASERKTKRLLDARDVSKSIAGKTLFKNLRCHLSPGVRLGLVGPNGSGKSTLLRILSGQLDPDAGEIERAENLRIVFFEQERLLPDLDLPLRKALSSHGDSVIFRDRPLHVAAWAKRFLFDPEQLEMAVGRLSGGERARVLIARLMLQPADVLMLDEPTNDLDIPTLEVLEENLLDFPGAIVLVTHDRYMLDSISTQVLGLDGRGGAGLYADYTQWETAMREQPVARRAAPAEPPAPSSISFSVSPARKRLSYMENREWEQIESRIHEAEAAVAAFEQQLQSPEITRDANLLREAYDGLQAAQQRVDELYQRWAELESKLQ